MSMRELFKDKSKLTFSNQANIYDSTYYGKHASKLYNSVIGKINDFKCTKVLDVGCGTGTILSLLSKNESISLSGVDLSEGMLNMAKQKLNDRVELKLGDSEQLPWDNSTFDAIICTDSFHHYPEPEKPDVILGEIVSILNIPKSTLTNAVDRLEKRNYINRIISKRDRRSYGLELTEEGHLAQKEHLDFEYTVYGRILNALDTDEENKLVKWSILDTYTIV
jgi:ubiquinone/menaquinone biosynthesis C-methylase UbiE